MPNSNNLEPPRLRSAFHGKGAAAYASVEARRQFARSLLRTSEKLFLAPLAALVASALSGYGPYLVGLWLVALALFGMAAYGRHYALVIYDTLPSKPAGSRRVVRAESEQRMETALGSDVAQRESA